MSLDTINTKRDKVVLITGASRGIGRATALKFARVGYIVVANYRFSEDDAKSLQKELLNYHPRSFIYRADVSKETEVIKMFDDLYRTFPKIDVLVNNAGVSEQCLLLDMTEERFLAMLKGTLLPVALCTTAYVKRQISLGEAGSAVSLSSIYGIDGGSLESHYSAAKAGIIGFTKAVAKEYAYMKIRANVVAPGAISTDMTLSHSADTLDLLKKEIPTGRLGTAEEVADAVFYLAEAEYTTGEVIRVAGGL